MFKKAIVVIFALECLSLLAFKFPILSLPLLIAAGIFTAYVSWRDLEWGIYILFGELFIGSRGHLLEFNLGFASVSLRLVIFAVVFGVWALAVILTLSRAKGKNLNEFMRSFGLPQDDKFAGRYLLLLFVIALGIISGYTNGNSLGNIFNDANGYLYLLILPAVLSVIKTREQITDILQILATAIIMIAFKTLLLFLWFTFGWPGVATMYHWVINQDFGEITGDVGSASRIFMQSQFWSLIGLFIFVFLEKKNWPVISAAILALIMSLSRSFWLGAIAGGIFGLIIVLWRLRSNLKQFLALGLKLGGIAVLEIAILYGIVALGGGGLAEAVSSRGVNPAQEAAGGARLLLLPELVDKIKTAPLFGSGFGTIVTYKSYLPDRITLKNPDGEIANFAFEWGYLDIMLKVGSIGLLIYLFFIANIFKLGLDKSQTPMTNVQTLGMLSGLVALLALNITTPYLNHPLGIGFLILVYSYLLVLRKENESTIS